MYSIARNEDLRCMILTFLMRENLYLLIGADSSHFLHASLLKHVFALEFGLTRKKHSLCRELSAVCNKKRAF
jgi:hypothetical protein